MIYEYLGDQLPKSPTVPIYLGGLLLELTFYNSYLQQYRGGTGFNHLSHIAFNDQVPDGIIVRKFDDHITFNYMVSLQWPQRVANVPSDDVFQAYETYQRERLADDIDGF